MTFEKVAKIIAEYKDIDVSTIKPESTFRSWASTPWTRSS